MKDGTRSRHLPINISPMLESVRETIRKVATNSSEPQRMSMLLPYAGEAVIRIPANAMQNPAMTGVLIEFLREGIEIGGKSSSIPHLYQLRLCLSGAYIDEHPASALELAVFRHESSGKKLPSWESYAIPGLPEDAAFERLIELSDEATRRAQPFDWVELAELPGIIARSLGRSRDPEIQGHAFEVMMLINQDGSPKVGRVTVAVTGDRSVDLRAVTAEIAQRHANSIHFNCKRVRQPPRDLDLAI